jgi:hypothetical protein
MVGGVIDRKLDERTGRPLDLDGEAVGSLTDEELERELTIAAWAPDRRRDARYRLLLNEYDHRRRRNGD